MPWIDISLCEVRAGITPSKINIILVVIQKMILCFFIPLEIGRGRYVLDPYFLLTYNILVIKFAIYILPCRPLFLTGFIIQILQLRVGNYKESKKPHKGLFETIIV